MQIPPVAVDQGGLFGRHQAFAASTSAGAFERVRRSPGLRTAARGVYTSIELNDLDRRERHLLEARALQLSLGDTWCVARRTAAVLHGLPLLGRAPDEVQLTRQRTTSTARSSSRHRHINGLLDSERCLLDGLSSTTLPRTVFDLVRRESRRSAVVVADAALRSGLALEELLGVLEAHRRWPGARQARWVFGFADGRAESPLESLGRVVCVEQDLPLFEPQVEVRYGGELVARVDGLWWDQLVVFEGDGALKFEGKGVLPALLARQERIREAGLPVVRASWEDVTRRRARWAAGARAELTDHPGRLRPGYSLVRTAVEPTPLDRSDHYLWTPLRDLSTQTAAQEPGRTPAERRVA